VRLGFGVAIRVGESRFAPAKRATVGISDGGRVARSDTRHEA
jgi:hypothetical protein